ncbi:hypothetical protein TSOC_009093 [Tetrabaena socialis]|uniref:Uncharacterized protein n=1 Tax=Tetrabaena socialis TaxID=47790 RepID=A0A2J7ZWQ4_9CHLO|nr:hypothetical protein TSOC_009093 [Tetrabaena socialis]|eukprot:PNH04711.1 hypothetical protein TSOC_009093 [Tetrabaena socialis]
MVPGETIPHPVVLRNNTLMLKSESSSSNGRFLVPSCAATPSPFISRASIAVPTRSPWSVGSGGTRALPHLSASATHAGHWEGWHNGRVPTHQSGHIAAGAGDGRHGNLAPAA